MRRLRVVWTGNAVVGPTVSTFYALDGESGFPAAVRTLMASLSTYIPSGTVITTPNNGDELDPATGELTGSWTDGTTPAIVKVTSPIMIDFPAACGSAFSTRRQNPSEITTAVAPATSSAASSNRPSRRRRPARRPTAPGATPGSRRTGTGRRFVAHPRSAPGPGRRASAPEEAPAGSRRAC